MDLSYICQTEYYAGLFTSSSKVTCHLSGGAIENQSKGFESWECQVCGLRNPPGQSPALAKTCGLCGVPRSSTPTPSHPHLLSTSLPSSSLSLSTASQALSEIACPACTFLNHPLLRECEICGTLLLAKQQQQKSQPRVKDPIQPFHSAPSSRPLSPDPDDFSGDADADDASSPKMIKLSFRKGGDKPFYTVLKSSLRNKTWEGSQLARSITPSNATGGSSTPGISGILKSVESNTLQTSTTLQTALQDLETLMAKAKDMVKLAAEMNDKLTAAAAASSSQGSGSRLSSISATTVEPEEATFIRTSLAQLGLQTTTTTPVTLDMMKDERGWLEELAKELGRLLQGQGGGMMMKNRGIIPLDEVWGGWNRIRGVALIPPSTFLQVLPLLPLHTSPQIQQRTFVSSGLKVLHTPRYAHDVFADRLEAYLIHDVAAAAIGSNALQKPVLDSDFSSHLPKTTIEIATSFESELPVGLVKEMIEAVEEEGRICRDDVGNAILGAGGEVKWWVNVFFEYVWDGQEGVNR